MKKQSLLLVEDEAAIADTVIYALETEGFDVQWETLGEKALDAAKGDFALMILDIGLPDMDGFEVCRTLRRFSDMPVIFLTARSQEIDRIVGLELGADDYVSKPFSPRELAARVKAILRRSRASTPMANTPRNEGFSIDSARALISYHGQALNLTRYEYLILRTLLQQPERVYSRAWIMQQVWPEPQVSLERSVDTHIKTLRAKLQTACPGPDPITTHRGLGYSIQGPAHEI
jgi:two-component system catabolic regulation response regulator CreB